MSLNSDRQMNDKQMDDFIVKFLEKEPGLTTDEIMVYFEPFVEECRDRIPVRLAILEKAGRLEKKLSVEKKGIIWSAKG